jgi:hypothetical protein
MKGAGLGSEFGFENPLRFFGLLSTASKPFGRAVQFIIE